MATPFVPYHPGTITVTNGAGAFTGSGTSFESYDEGDMLFVAGHAMRIETITSNTAGTFALDYPGATGAGLDYDWMPAADVTRALTLYASFQRLLVGGNLAALAALAGAANKMPMFSGAGTMTLLDAVRLSGIASLALTANQMFYATSPNGNSFAAANITAKSLAILAKTNNADVLTEIGAQAALAYTAANKAGDSFTGPVLLPDGSLSAPGLGFALDANTGLRRTGADILALVTGGADRLTIDAGGRMTVPGQPAYTANFGALTPGNDAVLNAQLNRGCTTSLNGVGGGTFVQVPVGGLYIVAARTPAKASPTVSLEIQVRKNGATVLGSGLAPVGAGSYAPANVTAFATELVAGDYLHLRCTAGENYNSSSTYNSFSLAKVA